MGDDVSIDVVVTDPPAPARAPRRVHMHKTLRSARTDAHFRAKPVPIFIVHDIPERRARARDANTHMNPNIYTLARDGCVVAFAMGWGS